MSHTPDPDSPELTDLIDAAHRAARAWESWARHGALNQNLRRLAHSLAHNHNRAAFILTVMAQDPAAPRRPGIPS